MSLRLLICCLLLVQAGPGGAAGLEPGRLADELERFFATAEPPAPGWLFALVGEAGTTVHAGGLADVAAGRTMDPETTTFPVASVSKPVAAALLVELAEAGELDLDRDVADYLDGTGVRVPRRHPGAITVGRLLTHTAGLDERWTGMAVRSADHLPSLMDFVARRLPPQVFPPGEVIRYTNDGFALAGAVAESVTGSDFAALAEDRLLRPLGMRESSFAVRPELEARLARGYRARHGTLHELERDYLISAPAAALVTTAPDMARFLGLHLASGEAAGEPILTPEGLLELQARRFAHHSALPGVGYGIVEGFHGSVRYLFHVGGLRGHSSLLLLVPDEGVGMFLAYNRGGTALARDWMERFLELAFPDEGDGAEAAARGATPAAGRLAPEAFVGTYRTVRIDRSTLARLASLVVFGPLRVGAGEDGGLRLRGLGEGWMELEPAGELLFRRGDGRGLVAFERDASGRAGRLYVGAEAFDRLRWFERAEAHVLAGAFFVLAFLAALRVRAARPSLPWLAGRREPVGRRQLWARRLAATVALLHLVFLVGIVWFFAAEGHWVLLYGLPPWVAALLVLPLVAGGLSLPLTGLCLVLWGRREGEPLERLRLCFFTAASWLFLLYLHHWNLLGFLA